MKSVQFKVLTLGVLGLLGMADANATPGQFEINQACVNVGCFDGDDPNTPTVEITKSSGIFYLTSDLVVASGDTHSTIEISVGDSDPSQHIVLDLNGYQIIKEGASAGDGIVVTGALNSVVIKNGEISGFVDGISMESNPGSQLLIENMNFSSNSDDAISSETNVTVRNSVFNCNDYGIFIASNNTNLEGPVAILDNNSFTCFNNNTQRPVSTFSSSSDLTLICRDNTVGYPNPNGSNAFQFCNLQGDNYCYGQSCQQQTNINVVTGKE